MRITLIGPSWPQRGGIARHTTELHRVLSEVAGVQAISFKRLFEGKIQEREMVPLNAAQLDVLRLIDGLNPVTWPAVVTAIVKYAPQAIILPWWTPVLSALDLYLIVSIRRKLRVQFMAICHTAGDRESSGAYKIAAKMVLRRCDCLVTECATAAASVRALAGPCARINTLRHPVSASAGPRLSREDARKRLGLDLVRPVLLFFGYVRPYKGLDVLLRAMATIGPATGAVLVVAGEIWSDRRLILRTIRSLALACTVRLWDRYLTSDEAMLVFRACDVVVMPYLRASGSGVFSLACEHGRPVVASALGPFEELVEDGITGRLVRPGEPQALAAAIGDVLRPDVLLGYEEALRRREKSVSWEYYARGLLDALNEGSTSDRAANVNRPNNATVGFTEKEENGSL